MRHRHTVNHKVRERKMKLSVTISMRRSIEMVEQAIDHLEVANQIAAPEGEVGEPESSM